MLIVQMKWALGNTSDRVTSSIIVRGRSRSFYWLLLAIQKRIDEEEASGAREEDHPAVSCCHLVFTAVYGSSDTKIMSGGVTEEKDVLYLYPTKVSSPVRMSFGDYCLWALKKIKFESPDSSLCLLSIQTMFGNFQEYSERMKKPYVIMFPTPLPAIIMT